MRSRRRGRPVRIGLVAALVLAACAPFTPDLGAPGRLQRGAEGGASILLLRFLAIDGGTPLRVGGVARHAEATLWDMRTGRPLPLGASAPSPEVLAAGWVAEALPAGSYMLEVGPPRPRLFDRTLATDDIACRLPGAHHYTIRLQPVEALYGGTIRLPCGDRYAAVQAGGAPRIEAEPASALPALPGRSDAPRIAPATPLDVAAAARGWPAPARIVVDADAEAWRASVDWGGPADFRRAEGALEFAGAAMDAAPSGGGELGAVIGAPFVAAAGIAFLTAGIVAGAEAASHAAAAAQRERSFAACLARLGAQVTPAATAAAIAPAVQAPPGGTLPWRVTLTRVVLRQCGDPMPIHVGVETATRWQADDREAFFARPVAGARTNPRMPFSDPAPWEARAGSDAACRPIEAYCAAGGEALALQDVTEAVAAARDLLLRGR